MPEFEEPKSNASSSESYIPSQDASPKPRTRRRSGGFKTEAVSSSSAKMGEIDPSSAIKEEKLSGHAKSGAVPAAAEQPAATKSRPSREPRAEREPRPSREPRAEREPRPSREPRAPRDAAPRDAVAHDAVARDTRPASDQLEATAAQKVIPQPSPATLAAIAQVEARLEQRRADRDTRRAERDKNQPERPQRKERSERPERKEPAERSQRKERTTGARSKNKKPAAKKAKSGLFAAISAFIGKLLGTGKAKKKDTGARGSNARNGNPRGRPQGNRGGQNRKSSAGRRSNGNRGGRGRSQAGSGGGQRRHTATSRSNES